MGPRLQPKAVCVEYIPAIHTKILLFRVDLCVWSKKGKNYRGAYVLRCRHFEVCQHIWEYRVSIIRSANINLSRRAVGRWALHMWGTPYDQEKLLVAEWNDSEKPRQYTMGRRGKRSQKKSEKGQGESELHFSKIYMLPLLIYNNIAGFLTVRVWQTTSHNNAISGLWTRPLEPVY